MPLLQFLASYPLLTLMLVLAAGALLGQIRFGALRFGAAGALFVGLLVGMLDPRLGQGLTSVKALGVVLFCYTVGLTTGSTIRSDLKRQWKLMIIAVLSLIVMAFSALGLGKLFGLSSAHMAGAFAGVLTSPAINDAIAVTHGSADTLAGYAIAYPTGVILGMIIVMIMVNRRWPAKRDNPSLAEVGLTATTVRVDRDCHIDDVPGWLDNNIQMSYLQREGETRVVSRHDDLRQGDKVLVVGNPDRVQTALNFLGHESSHDLTVHRRDVDFRRFLLSNLRLAGHSVGDLDFERRFGGVITRVRRNDLDMLAHNELILQPGDRLLAVVPRGEMGAVRDFLGDSQRGASQLNALTLGLGCALGLLAGVVSIPLGGGIRFGLGAAAGPMIVGIILGSVHKTGPLRWDLPYSVNATLRQIGLMIFLACVGLASGPGFGGQVFSIHALAIIGSVTIALVIGAALVYVGTYWLGLSAQRATGAFVGYVGQPAILSYANSRVNDERIESAYGAILAIGTIAKILLVQVIALM